MAAFRAAIAAGAHALETDIHLSADEQVVLSHDKDLRRCFGVDKRERDRQRGRRGMFDRGFSLFRRELASVPGSVGM